jgi:hypothetical protein
MRAETMATGRGRGRSDADLRDAVMTGWHRLVTGLRPGEDPLDSLVKRTEMPFRQLDMARRVRNQIAHPDEPVARDRLLGALRIIAEAEQQLQSRKPKRERPGPRSTRQRMPRGQGARPIQRDRIKQRAAPRRKATPTNNAQAIAAIVFAVLIVAAFILLITYRPF